MRERKKFPALPLGLKSEVLETRMKFHRISRGRDFLEVELLRYNSTTIHTIPEYQVLECVQL